MKTKNRKPKLIRPVAHPTDTKCTIVLSQSTLDGLDGLGDMLANYYGVKFSRNIVARRALDFYKRYILQTLKTGKQQANSKKPNMKVLRKCRNILDTEKEQLIKCTGRDPLEFSDLLR